MRTPAIFICMMVLAGLVMGSVLPRGLMCGSCDCLYASPLVQTAEAPTAAVDACCGGSAGCESDTEEKQEPEPFGCECVKCATPIVKVLPPPTVGEIAERVAVNAVIVASQEPAAVCGDGLIDPPRA